MTNLLAATRGHVRRLLAQPLLVGPTWWHVVVLAGGATLLGLRWASDASDARWLRGFAVAVTEGASTFTDALAGTATPSAGAAVEVLATVVEWALVLVVVQLLVAGTLGRRPHLTAGLVGAALVALTVAGTPPAGVPPAWGLWAAATLGLVVVPDGVTRWGVAVLAAIVVGDLLAIGLSALASGVSATSLLAGGGTSTGTALVVAGVAVGLVTRASWRRRRLLADSLVMTATRASAGAPPL